MNTIFWRVMSLVTILSLVMAACTSPTPQPTRVEEITFQSREFTLVGDLRTPSGTGPFPVVLLVHGSGDADRTLFGYYLPIMERMLRAGYAVFSWDKPGYGVSTGRLSVKRVYHQRAQIVLDAIDVMQARPDIDPDRIGLWGISMAGWVIPRVLMTSDEVAFIICVSCGSMSGADEITYQVVAQSYCRGVPEEEADQLEILLAELDVARTFDTYEGYLRYREVLDEQAVLGSVTVPRPVVSEAAWLANDPADESKWSPVHVIEQVRIPVLAVWGGRDTQIDLIRAAHAYRDALKQAGNLHYTGDVIPGVNHNLAPSETDCTSETGQTMERILAEQGFTFEDLEALDPKDPVLLTLGSAWPYTPKYLDLIEEWLRDLR